MARKINIIDAIMVVGVVALIAAAAFEYYTTGEVTKILRVKWLIVGPFFLWFLYFRRKYVD